MDDTNNGENIAQTLARELPKALPLGEVILADLQQRDGISLFAMPHGTELKQLDFEKLLPHPRRTQAKATLNDPEAFLAYVKRHATDATVCWAHFNPQTYALSFTAVIDEHAKASPGWRGHVAGYTPEASAEWKVWTGLNGKPQEQVAFAEFIERNEPDIASMEGYPTSLDMLQMATNFQANSDKRIKSVVRLQGGGAQLEYVDDANTETLERMKLFDKFQIGIPAFWAGPGYLITARLKYRQAAGKVTFWYELIRPDRVHEAAARELIAKVREGLGNVPLLMGSCS